LSYDSTEFKDLLDTSYSDVVTFLTDASGPLNTIRDRIEDVYVDPYEGTIKTRTDSLEDTIEGLEDSIADFEARMEDYEARLRTQFNSMEVVLGELYSTQSYLSALFAQE
jgi:flagellar hook-associated protein 2